MILNFLIKGKLDLCDMLSKKEHVKWILFLDSGELILEYLMAFAKAGNTHKRMIDEFVNLVKRERAAKE